MYRHKIGTLSRGAVLDVGLKCSHSCKFCYYSFLDGSAEQFRGIRQARFRSPEECKTILKFLKQRGFINFDYTGGEPTLHPDIIEITRYAHQDLGLKGRIITLGQFLTKKMQNCRHDRLIEDLLEAGLTNFLFSMHAMDEELFKKITGASLAKLRAAMDYLDNKGFQYTGNTTVFEWNYRHLPQIAAEVVQRGVYLHNFILMNAYYQWNRDGRACGVQARYAEILPYLKEAVDLLEAHQVAVNIRYAPLCAVRGMEKNLVGVVGVRYDPYEWMNLAGHMGGAPEFCARPIPLAQGQIEEHLAHRPLNMRLDNGVILTGARTDFKYFAGPCRDCRARDVCDGIALEYLKAHGESEFTPYSQPERAPLQRARYGYPMPFMVKMSPDTDMKALIAQEFAVCQAAAADREKGAITFPVVGGACPEVKPCDGDNGPHRPTFSVIIPAYNVARFIKETIDSILQQPFQDLEIIVVDDGSTDGTAQAVREFGHRVQYFCKENDGFQGPGGAINLGLQHARGRFIHCLDGDDLVTPAFYERVLERFNQDPNLGAVATDAHQIDDHGTITGPFKLGHFHTMEEFKLESLQHDPIISSSMVVKRECYDKVGGRRPEFEIADDYDLWLRIGEHFDIAMIPEPLVKYRVHGDGISNCIEKTRQLDAKIIHEYLERNNLEYFFPILKLAGSSENRRQALVHLGVILVNRGFSEKAIAAVQEALELGENSALSQNILGVAYFHQGKKTRAKRHFLQALEIEPGNQSARENLEKMGVDLASGGPAPRPPAGGGRSPVGNLNLMMVVHSFPPYNLAGTEIYTYNLAQELRRRGHAIRVLHAELDDTRPEGVITEDVYQDLPVTRVNLHSPDNFIHTFKNEALAEIIGRYLDSHPVDLIHFQHLLQLSVSLLQVCADRRIPTVMTAHDEWLICQQCHLLQKDGQLCPGPETVDRCVQCFMDRYPRIPREQMPDIFYILALRRQLLLNSRNLMDTFLVPSRFLKETLAAGGFEHPRTLVSPLGLAPFQALPWQEDPEVMRFTFIGNMHHVKGVDILIQAFNLAAAHRARLDLYGYIQQDSFFQNALAQANPQRRIEYHGPYTPADLPEILARTDVAVIPSRSESYSFTVRECLQARVPVIASRVAALPEIIRHGENGLLFNPNDPRDLADKMNFFIQEPKHLHSFRQRIKPVLTIEENASELEKIYHDTLQGCVTASTEAAASPRLPKIGFIALEPHNYACPFLRLQAPLTHLHQQREITYLPLKDMVMGQPYYIPAHLPQLDVIVIQRQVAFMLPFARLREVLKQSRTKIVFEIDDALTMLPPHHNDYEFYRAATGRIEEYLARADLVTVTTPGLKSLYSRFNKNIAVLPNSLDMTVWSPTWERAAAGTGPVKILFSGTLTHARDLQIIEEVIIAIMREFGDGVKFLFWGNAPERLAGYPQVQQVYEFASDYLHYARLLKELEVDLAIVPLENNDFNRAKSAIKWLEYSICRIPAIFTDIEAYNRDVEHLETGMLVPNQYQEWYEALKTLILNPVLRQEIAQKAHDTVRQRYTLENNAHLWLEAYSRLFTSGASSALDDSTGGSADFPETLEPGDAGYQENIIGETAPQVWNADTGPEELLQKTNEALERQDWSAAEGYLQEITRCFPDLLESYLSLSDVLTVQGKDQEAAQVLRDARQVFPEALPLLLRLGLNCRRRGDLSGAMAAFTEAWNRNPRDSELLGHLGGTCIDLGLFQEAQGYLQDAVRINPQNIDAWLGLARVAQHREDQEAFDEACRQGKALNPHHPRLRELTKGRKPGNGDGAAALEEVRNAPASGPGQVLASIIIPVFNNLSLTRQCLESIWGHTAAPYEIILVDNGSSDGTPDYLRRLEAAGRLRVITNATNLGFTRASNQGARAARGEYLVFLNNDTIVQPGWLEEMAACARKDEKIGAVGAKLLYPDDSVQHAGVVFNGPHRIAHIYKHFNRDHPAVNKEREFQAVTAACMLIRKDLFLTMGLFDESYHNGLEDVDLCFKLRESGYKIVYNPRAVVYHLESKTPGRYDLDQENFRVFVSKWSGKIIPDADKYYQEDDIVVEIVDRQGNVSNILAHDRSDNPPWREATQLRQAGDLYQAEACYIRALKYNPFDPRNGLIAQELAEVYQTQGKTDQAEKFFQMAARLIPKVHRAAPEECAHRAEAV